MKKSISRMLLIFAALAVLAGCNTMRGVGQDVEEGGEAIQKSTQ
jgi:entericidin B